MALTVLRVRRLARNMKLGALASELGVTHSGLSQIEKGKVRPREPIRRQLEKIFGQPADQLLNFVEEKESN